MSKLTDLLERSSQLLHGEVALQKRAENINAGQVAVSYGKEMLFTILKAADNTAQALAIPVLGVAGVTFALIDAALAKDRNFPDSLKNVFNWFGGDPNIRRASALVGSGTAYAFLRIMRYI